MAVKTQGRSWKVLLMGLAGLLLIWTLANATPVLFEWMIEGEVSKLTAVGFFMGLWGAFSYGMIDALSEKIGYMDGKNLRNAGNVVDEVNRGVAGTLKPSEGFKEVRKTARDYDSGKIYADSVEEPTVEPPIPEAPIDRKIEIEAALAELDSEPNPVVNQE